MIFYDKLWKLLAAKGMKKSDLKEVVSTVTLAKLGKNETVTTETIDKICMFLDCQPGDIMESYTKEKLDEMEEKLQTVHKTIIEVLEAKGISFEDYSKFSQDVVQDYLKSSYYGDKNATERIKQKSEELLEKAKSTEEGEIKE